MSNPHSPALFRIAKATGALATPAEFSSHLNLLLHEFGVGLHQGSPVGKWWVVASNAKGEKGNLRFVKPGLPGVRPLGTMTVEAEARVTFEAAQDLSHYYKGKPEKVTLVTLDPADPLSHTHPDREGVANDPRDRSPDGLTLAQVATLRARAVAALHTYRAALQEIKAPAGVARVEGALSALGA